MTIKLKDYIKENTKLSEDEILKGLKRILFGTSINEQFGIKGSIGKMIPKFRAWDKVNKEMIEDVASIHFKTEMIVTSNLCFYPFKDIELMQSSGIFDKNGKEIFEGYIVEFKNPYDKRSKARGIIVWREDKACFGIDMEGTTEQFELYRITAENYLTVIGNIYQDEHLLEEE